MRTALIAFMLGLVGAGSACAQSLDELYTAARGYDATYLSARALADSAQFKAAQAKALLRPSAGLATSVNVTQTEFKNYDSSERNRAATLSATQPLFNRTSSTSVELERRESGPATEVVDRLRERISGVFAVVHRVVQRCERVLRT